MLFNSYSFIFICSADRFGRLFRCRPPAARAPVIWLALASLVFYSFSNWPFVALLLGSIAFNYLVGWLLISRRLRAGPRFAVLTSV